MGRILFESTWKCYCCGKQETQHIIKGKSEQTGIAPLPWSDMMECCKARFCKKCIAEHPVNCPACQTSFYFIVAFTIAIILFLSFCVLMADLVRRDEAAFIYHLARYVDAKLQT
jgi:hypothetical protein